MKNKKFRNFIDNLREETTSGDISSVETKLGTERRKPRQKGKKCKEHKKFNCRTCEEERYN